MGRKLFISLITFCQSFWVLMKDLMSKERDLGHFFFVLKPSQSAWCDDSFELKADNGK